MKAARSAGTTAKGAAGVPRTSQRLARKVVKSRAEILRGLQALEFDLAELDVEAQRLPTLLSDTDPRTYLEVVGNWLSAPEYRKHFAAERLAELADRENCAIVMDFRRRLDVAVRRLNPQDEYGYGCADLAPEVRLCCALETLGLPPKKAHDWLKFLPIYSPRTGFLDEPRGLLLHFAVECCHVDANAREPFDRVYRAYEAWCVRQPKQIEKVSTTLFSAYLPYARRHRSTGGKLFLLGIKLKVD